MSDSKKRNICFSHKLLIIFTIILVILTFTTNTVFGATYDLSDYKNHDLKNGVWCIVYSKTYDKIYLIVGERGDYRYLFCGTKTDENGNKYPASGWSTMKYLGDYNAQGGAGRYVFNTETNKFDSYVYYGIGGLNLGECEIIASGVNIYSSSGWTSFFQKTPVPGKVVIKPTLVETLAKALGELIQTIVEKITTIIPIGLLVLSIGLLIYVIKSVILRTT